jgi:hypothetical protein
MTGSRDVAEVHASGKAFSLKGSRGAYWLRGPQFV